MESMINRIYSMSDADTKPFFAATSVLASNAFRLALSRLSNNKAIIAFAALLCFLFTANTHAQTLEWVKSFGGKRYDQGFSIAIDVAGNVYTTGTFSDTVDFDPGTGITNLSAVGNKDIFIQKLDAQGSFLWAKSFGGKVSGFATSIAIDAQHNVYTTGGFRDTVDFDPGVGLFNLSAVGEQDIFIQKLDSNGNFLWAKSFGGNYIDLGTSIAVDIQGNVYTTGYFIDTVDFDPGPDSMKISSVGFWDSFIQKLDANGNFLLVKTFGGKEDSYGFCITLDAANNVYTSGDFYGTVDFDPGPDSMMLYAGAENKIFIQKLDAQGNFLWVKTFGGEGYDYCSQLTTDAAGNVYSTGFFEDTVDFDPEMSSMKLSAVGNYDIFVHKLDTQGNFLWAKSFGGKDKDAGYSIAIDAENNVYTSGNFNNTVDFDPGPGVANLSAIGESDIFIQKLDAQGNFLWAKSFGGNLADGGSFIVVDSVGDVFTTGSFRETVDFDPGSDVKNLTSVGDHDIFVHKMKQTTTGVADMGNGIDISLYPNPSKGFIHISLKDNAGDAIITITDLQGKVIHSEEMSAATTSSIDIQAPDGVYFVNVKTAKGQTISKFIKE